MDLKISIDNLDELIKQLGIAQEQAKLLDKTLQEIAKFKITSTVDN